MYYWPIGMPTDDGIENFVQTFCKCLQYEACSSEDLEAGYLKVAIYSIGDRTKHLARQLSDGRWTSKLGAELDLSHQLSGLEGAEYGHVARFLKRKL